MFQDKQLSCKECGDQFTFTVGEQEFYKEKAFQNEPARCPACRRNRKAKQDDLREFHKVNCSQCGGTATVPFIPQNDKPVYCRDCFQSKRNSNNRY